MTGNSLPVTLFLLLIVLTFIPSMVADSIYVRESVNVSVFQLAFGVGQFQVKWEATFIVACFVFGIIATSMSTSFPMMMGVTASGLAFIGFMYMLNHYHRNSTILGSVEFKGIFYIQMLISCGLVLASLFPAIKEVKEYAKNKQTTLDMNEPEQIVANKEQTVRIEHESSYCPNCNSAISSGMEFCDKCGIYLEWAKGISDET